MSNPQGTDKIAGHPIHPMLIPFRKLRPTGAFGKPGEDTFGQTCRSIP